MSASISTSPRIHVLSSVLFPALAVAFVGCSKGRDAGPPGGDLIVMRTQPTDNGTAFLNDPVMVDLSHELDPESVDFNAVSFAVFDLQGNALAESVEGRFRVAASPTDGAPGRQLQFLPRFPITDTLDDGGFKPGRRYVVQLVRGDHRANVGLLDTRGKGLAAPFSFTFQTVDGTTNAQLFRDTLPGGPRLVGFEVTPVDATTGAAELNESGQVATEIRLQFDQALSPHSSNLPLRVDLDPRLRDANRRGRIYLEYEDVEGVTWIPAAFDLEKNALDGSIVVLRPLGVLPNNAEIRVVVTPTLEDLAGESNVNNQDYDPVVGRFRTDDSYELRFDAVVENFVDAGKLDLGAAFVEPIADIVPGAIRASFAFEGGRSKRDYAPDTAEVILNTDFTQITPTNGQTINVSGGQFSFDNVRIPLGASVRGVGSQPMVWLVTGDFVVEGDLRVEGGNGMRVNTIFSANIPAAGGVGSCGGGNGGQGSPNTASRSLRGEPGFGPGQVPNRGGQGGRLNCDAGCNIGSGGGGGTFATRGDPWFKVAPNQFFVQPRGIGGFGCRNRNSQQLAGGQPGPLAFVDLRRDNEFWGSAVDLFRNLRITGELSKPQGGQGGGGGGDWATNCSPTDPLFAADQKGGGGGAGGGVLIIKALGSIIIKRTGRISADGGDGGGGAFAGSNTVAGGGGGGSGGMVVLMAGKSVVIETHGETYANNDYSFAITAEGGVGLRDGFGGVIRSKYSPPPHTQSATSLNGSPSGGFGGHGIVQIMAPPGPNPDLDDETNTLLDDYIIIRDANGKALTGADKARYLGWRGMADGKGGFHDDRGSAVTIGARVGDIRPAPILLPAPFGSRSRMRSKWLDMGAVDRRVVASGGDGLPRGVATTAIGPTFGPLPEFQGVVGGTGSLAGYAEVRDENGGVVIDYPVVVADLRVATVTDDVRYRGQSVVRVELPAPAAKLAAQSQRYSHYIARLRAGAAPLGEFRILGHDAAALYLSKESGAASELVNRSPDTLRLDVVAKLFSIHTDGQEGFPESFEGRAGGPGRTLLPRANVRFRFAFHQDPSDPAAKRFPATPGEFFADWTNPAVIEQLRQGGYRFVQYDILFETRYQESSAFPNENSLSPDNLRPEVRRLVLPYRY